MDVDLALIDQYDTLILDLELTIVREAKRHDADAFHRLRSVPGIGKVLALTILYEIHEAKRYAQRHGTSLSGLIERALRDASASDAPTFSTRWRGRFKPARRTDKRYRLLAKKYL